MDREELIALHAALGGLLALPDSVRELLVKWLMPKAVKPNGHDRHPPPGPTSPPTRAKAKNNFEAVRRAKLTDARAAEQKLLRAMADNPGLSIIALANAADASRSTTQQRLQRLFVPEKLTRITLADGG